MKTPKFLSKSKKMLDPVFPRAYDLRTSEIFITKIAMKEKDRLKKQRLFEIKEDLVSILRAL